jgi:hypothetical protein
MAEKKGMRPGMAIAKKSVSLSAQTCKRRSSSERLQAIAY